MTFLYLMTHSPMVRGLAFLSEPKCTKWLSSRFYSWPFRKFLSSVGKGQLEIHWWLL